MTINPDTEAGSTFKPKKSVALSGVTARMPIPVRLTVDVAPSESFENMSDCLRGYPRPIV